MRQCSLCGTNIDEAFVLLRYNYSACFPCIDTLVENEIEDRGVKEEARRFAEHHGANSMPEDRERDQLRDAGRGHLT